MRDELKIVEEIKQLGKKQAHHAFMKFFDDPEHYLQRAKEQVALCKLHRCDNVLDIGGAAGYFCYAAREIGCFAWNVDVYDEAYMEVCCKFLCVPYISHTCSPVKKFPFFRPDYFDVITCFGVNFAHKSDDFWSKEDYTLFIRQVWDQLKVGGRWYWRPNNTNGKAYQIDPAFFEEKNIKVELTKDPSMFVVTKGTRYTI